MKTVAKKKTKSTTEPKSTAAFTTVPGPGPVPFRDVVAAEYQLHQAVARITILEAALDSRSLSETDILFYEGLCFALEDLREAVTNAQNYIAGGAA